MARKLDFSDVILYGITSSVRDEAFALKQAERMLAGGVDVIQLRTKELKDRAYLSLAGKMRDLCRAHDALFIVNNRPDLAVAAGAGGVHLGHEDMPIPVARGIVGYNKIIGASTHSVTQALEAERQGADYVSCGPLWATPSKPEYPAVGLGLIQAYRKIIKVPFVAIGGVNEENIDEVVKAGAKRVAVVRALFESPYPEKTARVLKEKILENWKKTALVRT